MPRSKKKYIIKPGFVHFGNVSVYASVSVIAKHLNIDLDECFLDMGGTSMYRVKREYYTTYGPEVLLPNDSD